MSARKTKAKTGHTQADRRNGSIRKGKTTGDTLRETAVGTVRALALIGAISGIALLVAPTEVAVLVHTSWQDDETHELEPEQARREVRRTGWTALASALLLWWSAPVLGTKRRRQGTGEG